jgi:hypothetical protein
VQARSLNRAIEEIQIIIAAALAPSREEMNEKKETFKG